MIVAGCIREVLASVKSPPVPTPIVEIGASVWEERARWRNGVGPATPTLNVVYRPRCRDNVVPVEGPSDHLAGGN